MELPTQENSAFHKVQLYQHYITVQLQRFLDASNPWLKTRWSCAFALLLLYIIRY
jgi:hypothetical protein